MIDAPIWTISPFVGLVFLAASIGGAFRPDEWYYALDKPNWTPPDWAFPVVWTILYVVMAFAAWRVWDIDGIGLAIILWGMQLALNAGWSMVFFGMKNPELALAELVAFWLALALTLFLFAQIDMLAAALMVPYIIWVTVAGALNLSIVLRRLKAS